MAHDKVYGYCENLCKVELNDLFVLSRHTTEEIRVSGYANGNFAEETDYMRGYRPIIVNVNADSPYVRATRVSVLGKSGSERGGELRINFYNHSSSSETATFTVTILWIKNEFVNI